jgi:hypothetical protein
MVCFHVTYAHDVLGRLITHPGTHTFSAFKWEQQASATAVGREGRGSSRAGGGLYDAAILSQSATKSPFWPPPPRKAGAVAILLVIHISAFCPFSFSCFPPPSSLFPACVVTIPTHLSCQSRVSFPLGVPPLLSLSPPLPSSFSSHHNHTTPSHD